jgi:hypothetical protein
MALGRLRRMGDGVSHIVIATLIVSVFLGVERV